MSSNARIAIIGAGIGASHLRGYKSVSNAQVVALCDSTPARAQSVLDVQGVQATVYADYREMLERERPDAVSVCLPNALHLPVAVACLEAGAHVLCEKPLATNAEDAQTIADAATGANKQCMVGQVLRFRPDSQALKRENAGSIYYARATSIRARGIPGYGGWFTTQRLSGGGALIDMGVHLLDLAWWLAGCPRPVSAFGITRAEFGPRKLGMGANPRDVNGPFDVEDLAVALVTFENGLTINLEIAWALNGENQTRCEVFGTRAGLIWGDEPRVVRAENGEVRAETLQNLPPRGTWRDAMWAAQCEHFVSCARNNTMPAPDATQGVTMMKMLDAIYQSAREGREVAISR